MEKIEPMLVEKLMDAKPAARLVDVRMPEEYRMGHIAQAINIPDFILQERAKELLPDKTNPVVVYCRSGRRSSLAARLLEQLGYERVYDLGAISAWPHPLTRSAQ